MRTALDGIRVVDLTQVIAGPFATQILGDLGADVIKVDQPALAPYRRTGLGPTITDADGNETSFSALWLNVNRNKREITLDLHTEAGIAVLGDLIRASDVVVENLTIATGARLGITEAWARALKPDIIWASLSGYGRTGPERARGAFDILSQARGGLASITGDPSGPPMKAGNSYTDYHAGYNLVIGVLAALRYRDNTGEGQLVDIALLDSMLPSLDGYPLWYSVAGQVVGRFGNDHPMNLPGYSIFSCSDGYIAIGGSQGPIWSRLAVAIGRDDLSDAPDMHDAGWDAFSAIAREALVAWVTPRTRAEVREVLDEYRVPNDPVHDLGEIWDDEQLKSRDMFVDYDYPPLGRIKAVGSPLKLSATPVTVWRTPPAPGEQTDEILRDVLGYDDEQIAELAAAGIFVTY